MKKIKTHPRGPLVGPCVLALIIVSSSAAPAVEATHKYFRFTPTLLRETPGGANSIQLSEFEFLLQSAPLDLTGVFVTNPEGDNPLAEGPGNLIDLNTNTKWLDFNKHKAVIFEFIAPVTIDAYSFTTANDFAARDPISWVFEGSDDGATWVLLDSIENYPTTTLRLTPEAEFALPAAPPPVILDFVGMPTIILNGTSSDLTWSTTNAATVEIDTAIGSVPNSGVQAVNPPDDTDALYTMTATNPQGTAMQSTVVRTVAGGSVSYQFIRFTPIKMRGQGGENSIQLAEFEFLSGGALVVPASVTNPTGNSPPGEGAANVIDASTATKWLDFNKGALEFNFGTAVSIDSYRFTTANDNPGRDPVQWLMEGSADQVTWDLIENVTAFDFPTDDARFATVPDIPLPGPSLRPYVLINAFFVDQATAIAGEEVVLHWSIGGDFDSVEIDNGIGLVQDIGFQAVTPPATTTYTLSVIKGGAAPVTVELTVTLVNPSITDICYADFDAAGDELELLGSAEIVNDSAAIPLPGNVSRLRLNGDLTNLEGSAWFRRRFDFSQGFDTTFDLHMVSSGLNDGADGISFIIHDNLTGTQTHLEAFNEEGLPANALNISFDSHLNGVEPSAATVSVKDGNFLLAEADLTAFPQITLDGTDSLDLTQDDANAAPYRVRITYVPGDLDVWFDGVLVVDSVDVDLDAIFAIDANGKGFVGFTARTGGSTEAHDITSWCLTEGPPATRPELEIVDATFNLDTNRLTLKWTSVDTHTYRITRSTDGQDFSTVVANGIGGAVAASQTTATVGFTPAPVLLFRIELE